jgi:hypothetical protein
MTRDRDAGRVLTISMAVEPEANELLNCRPIALLLDQQAADGSGCQGRGGVTAAVPACLNLLAGAHR